MERSSSIRIAFSPVDSAPAPTSTPEPDPVDGAAELELEGSGEEKRSKEKSRMVRSGSSPKVSACSFHQRGRRESVGEELELDEEEEDERDCFHFVTTCARRRSRSV